MSLANDGSNKDSNQAGKRQSEREFWTLQKYSNCAKDEGPTKRAPRSVYFALGNAGVGKRPVKPDTEPPSDFEYCQRFGVVPSDGMSGAIPGDANLVKQVTASRGTTRSKFKSTQEIGLGLFGRSRQTSFCRGPLRQNLGKLPELDQAGIWVVFEVALGLTAQQHELRIVFFQESQDLPR